MFLVSCFVTDLLELFRRKMTNTCRFPAKAVSCEVSSSFRGIWPMGNPCGYFLRTSFSKICSFNRKFKTKCFCGGKSIIRRSFVAAIYQNKPLSPVSFFNCRNGLLDISGCSQNHRFLGKELHASEPIRTTVVDTPYRGGVLCLMWWIRHTEAGYYANVVGYYAWCGGYAIQRRSIMHHHVSIIPRLCMAYPPHQA